MAQPAFDQVFESASILPPSVQLSDLFAAADTIQEQYRRIAEIEAQLTVWSGTVAASVDTFHAAIRSTGVLGMTDVRREWQAKLEEQLPAIDSLIAQFRRPFSEQLEVVRLLKKTRRNQAASQVVRELLAKLEDVRRGYLAAYEHSRLEVLAIIAELDPESRPGDTVLSSADDLAAYLDGLR